MTLGSLENPIRVTWDLFGSGYAAADETVTTVLQRLIEARPFFVLLEEQPLLHPQIFKIAAQLSAHGCGLTLMLDGTPDEIFVLSDHSLHGAELLLRAEPFCTDGQPDEQAIENVIREVRDAGFNPGLSLVPGRNNIEFLLSLYELCCNLELPRFKLPNVRIDNNFQALSDRALRPDDLENFRQEISAKGQEKGACQLEIHDLFLWELLAPERSESRSEYGGCQAGNSLAHIRFDGAVWPCITWPSRLGSLLDSSFATIWASAKRAGIRRAVAAEPAGCSGCQDYGICFGGCRGLSQVLDIAGGIDPMCKGPR